MNPSVFLVLFFFTFAAHADTVNLATLTIQVTYVNGRAVNTPVVRTQIWVLNGMISSIVLQTSPDKSTWTATNYMVSLQDPWTPVKAACDGTQDVAVTPNANPNTFLVSAAGVVNLDFSTRLLQKSKEFHLCLSSKNIETADQASTNNALKHYFTIDTLFSVWVVSDNFIPANPPTESESPCVCSKTCTTSINQNTNQNVDCATIKLYGPVSPPVNANIKFLGGVKNSWAPPNALFGTVSGFEFGIPSGADWYMPISLTETAYPTRGPFDSSFFANGGWTISFVAATITASGCGQSAGVTGAGAALGGASAAVKPDWNSGLNWIPDNRTSIKFTTAGTGTTAIKSGTIGWVRISEKVSDTAGYLCLGISPTGAAPRYQVAAPGATTTHDFIGVGNANALYRVNKISPVLQRFGGTGSISGAAQMTFSPGTRIQYATSHVNVEVDMKEAFSNTDINSFNGATVLISLQKEQNCKDGDLTGISTPTFVEVRYSSKSTVQGSVLADWERKAFARLYSTQLQDSWSDLFVCYAVVPIWFHRFNSFGDQSFYGSNGLPMEPNPAGAIDNQFFFPTPDIPANPETATISMFKQATTAASVPLKFTIVPTGKVPRILTFGRRTGESCNAVGFVENEGNANIPVTLSCDVGELIGSTALGNLLDVVVGVSIDSQCKPYQSYAASTNGRYGIQRAPVRLTCEAAGTSCKWTQVTGCNYATTWSSAVLVGCYGGSSYTAGSYPYYQTAALTAANTGELKGPIEQMENGALCVAVVPKQAATSTSWHSSGYDLNDMIQAASFHRKLTLHMVLKATGWTAIAINNVGPTLPGLQTTGAVKDQLQRVPVQVELSGFVNSKNNCPLNAFQIHFCYVRGTIPNAATGNPCQLITATSADCGVVTSCNDGDASLPSFQSASKFYGWASIKGTIAGEAIVCAQISSSYGYDATLGAASAQVANTWNPTINLWDTTNAAKPVFPAPTTLSQLFYIVERPTISSIGGAALNSMTTIGVPHENGRTQFIPIVVTDVTNLMPVVSTYTVTSNMNGVARAGVPTRIRAIDLVVTLTNQASCNNEDLIHYESTTKVNTFVAYTATKDWGTTFNTAIAPFAAGNPLNYATNFAQLKLVRPAFQSGAGRSAHGPISTFARVCYQWIPAGWTLDGFAQTLGGVAPTQPLCMRPIAKNYVDLVDAKIYYSQVEAPARLNWVRDTCGSVGTKYFNIPVFAYDANNVDISANFPNITVYVSQQEVCSGVLPPFNNLALANAVTAPYPYANLAGLKNQNYLSIEKDTHAFPMNLVFDQGRLWYRGLSHHYVSTLTCVVVAPSWLLNRPAKNAEPVWTKLLTENNVDIERAYGIDEDNILNLRLSASDFNDNNQRYSTRRFRNAANQDSRFHATPVIGTPQIATIGGVVVNRGAAASNKIFMPSFSNTLDPTDASQTRLIFPGSPQFLVTLSGLNEDVSLGPTDTNVQIIRSSQTCGAIDSTYQVSEQDRISVAGACCQANVTRRNYASLQYMKRNGVNTVSLQFDLIKNFESMNNETNKANVTTCYKVCQAVVSCGEIPSKQNFTDANYQICIVPEVLLRTQVPQLPSLLLFNQRTPVNFSNSAIMVGLCPYISFQATTTTTIISTTDSTRPLPLAYDSNGWYFSLANTPSTFWTSIRAITAKLIPQFTVSHCGQTLGTQGTGDDVIDQEISAFDFNYATSLRKALGMPQPTEVQILAPTCNEMTNYLATKLPPQDTASCTAFATARNCPTVISMFGKQVTGPRLTSLSETCNALASNLVTNVATVVGPGSHKIPVAGYRLDIITTWVSLQKIDKANYPCDGKRQITGTSTPRMVKVYQDCSNATQMTDMWGVRYEACPQQNGYFILDLAASEITTAAEYAICITYLAAGGYPISSDFNDRLDIFSQNLNAIAGSEWCGSTCAQPIKLHIILLPSQSAPVVKCLGGCTIGANLKGDATIAFAPSNARSQIPIEITRPAALVALGPSVQPDIWVSLEEYSALSEPCRSNDILTPTTMCANGNQLHTRPNMTRYYPLLVMNGFSKYSPGGQSRNAWFTTNYSITLDAFVTSKPGNFTLIFAVTTNGVPPVASLFSAANGCKKASCTLKIVAASNSIMSPMSHINQCSPSPRAYLMNVNTNLDTYVSLQKDNGCGDINALIRGTDETYMPVSKVAEGSPCRYYYNLTKRLIVQQGLTICVAQMACGALPTVDDFNPVSNVQGAPLTVNVIAPSKFVFPLPKLTCDGSAPNSMCTAANVAFVPCKQKTSDTSNTCIYAAAGCPIARCSVDGVCGNPAFPVEIQDNNNVPLYDGCNIRIRTTNKMLSTFPNVTNLAILDGILNFTNYYQTLGGTPQGADCNSFIFEADCGCGTNIVQIPSVGVKTQSATSFNVSQYPECLFFGSPMKYVVGFNSTQERQIPIMVNALDAYNVSMFGDVLSTATLTAVTTACTLTNAATNPNCVASTCLSFEDNTRTIGRNGPPGMFNFSGVLVSPLQQASCSVKILITYTMTSCSLGTTTYYSLSPLAIPASTIATSPCGAFKQPDGTNPPVPLTDDAQYRTPAPIATAAPGNTVAPTPAATATPAAYSSGASFSAKTIATIASYPGLAQNYGIITEFQVCPGRHADKCATPLNISMMLNGPAVRKNDGADVNPELVVRFPVTGNQLKTTCTISHDAGSVTIQGSFGLNVAPLSAWWNPTYCELVVVLGCSQVTGRFSILVNDFTINKKVDPGVYPAVLVRNRDVYDSSSPPNVILLAENVNPTCDEVNPIIDNLDLAIVDDTCQGKANLEICMTTTNEIQSAGSMTIEFRTLAGSSQFTHTDGDVRVSVLRIQGIKANTDVTGTSNATASWASASGANPAVLTIRNRGGDCWPYGQICFKVMDFNVPTLPTTKPGEYCAASFSPSNTPIDTMMVDTTTTRRCAQARSDTVNAISNLRVQSPANPTAGGVDTLNVPLTFSFTLSQGLKPFDCVTIDVPFYKNNNPVLPLITGRDNAMLTGLTSRYYDVVDGVQKTRSEHNANPSRFFNAQFTNNNPGCGGQLKLCTSCAIAGSQRADGASQDPKSGGNQNGTNFCTRLTFTVGKFFAPPLSTYDACTQGALVPFASQGRLVNWNIFTPDLTVNNFDKESVYPQNVLGGAKLQVTHTYTVPLVSAGAAPYPFNRYAREAHAAHLTLFFTIISGHSIMKDDIIKITFPCDEGKRYASDVLFFQNSPMAYCKPNQKCSHSCLRDPVWDQALNTLTVISKCPFEAGTTLPFSLAPFTSPLVPAKKETFKFQLSITKASAAIKVDSAIDTLALTHDLEGISNFAVTSLSCVPGVSTTLSVSLTVTRLVTGGAIIVVFPDNTWHPSYSTLMRSNDGLTNLKSGLEGLIPLTTTAQFSNDYEVYWRNQTFEYWSDALHKPIMSSTRNQYGDREQALFIFPKNGQKFKSTTISVDVLGLVNPWKRSWDSASFGGSTSNSESTNPSGAYRGNWQFKRIEYRADAFGSSDSNARGGNAQQTGTPTFIPAQAQLGATPQPTGSSWYLGGGDNTFIHLPVIRTLDWYFAGTRANRISGNARLAAAYVNAPAPYQQFPAFQFSAMVDINYPNANYLLYATEGEAARILTPAGLTLGIRELSVVPSNRTVGAKNIFLTVSFRTCASIGRSGRIEIAFGVQKPRDGKVLTGALKDTDGNGALLTTVNQFDGSPFMNFDGPVSVEDGNSGKMYEGYFQRTVSAGLQKPGGILIITALDEFTCGKAQSDTWKFIIGKKFGAFTSNTFPLVSPGLIAPLTPECLDPGFYQIMTYSYGCIAPSGRCSGAASGGDSACGSQIVEVSTYLNPTDDWMNDDKISASVSFVDIPGDVRLGQRMPCTINSVLQFTAIFRKRVIEGDTLKFSFPTAPQWAFSHSVDATVQETVNATYRALLNPTASWDNVNRVLTVTFARTPTIAGVCSLIPGGECLVAVVFTVDGFKNPYKSGVLPNMTATLNLQVPQQTREISTNFAWATIEKLQFTSTVLTPKMNAISDILFEFPSIPCYVNPGSKIKVTFPPSFKVMPAPLTVLMPNLFEDGKGSEISFLTASVSGQTLTLTLPAASMTEPRNYAACAINNARRLQHVSGAPGIRGRSRNCEQYNNKDACINAGCVSDCNNLCFDGNLGRFSVRNFVNNSQLSQVLQSGFRVLVQSVVQNPTRPGDPGAYEFQITDDTDAITLSSSEVNPTNENVEENTDLIQGIDFFDIKPAACTWATSRDSRSVALDMSFIKYGATRGASPGSEIQVPSMTQNSPYNTFTTVKPNPAGSNPTQYSTGTTFSGGASMWRNGKMHQIEVCFPQAEFSYTWMGRGNDRPKRSYDPLNYFGIETECAAGTETDNSIPVSFITTPKFNNSELSNFGGFAWTTSVEIGLQSGLSWFSSTKATAVTRCALVEGQSITRKNTLFARWNNDTRCVLIETYEDLPNGKYIFRLGTETGMNGFTQGHPLPDEAMSGRKVELLGPKSGIVRDKNDNKQYVVTLRDRMDDTRDALVNIDTTQAKFWNKQCMAPIPICTASFVAPSDAVRSGISDFDVVPSKCSPSANDVWLTFSMTIDVAMSESSGLDIIFPPFSWNRGGLQKCDHRQFDEIDVEVLSHTQIGTPSASSKLIATGKWIINIADFKNKQANGVRDYNAGVLRMNFTVVDAPWKAVEPGYIVFRVGGWTNPPRIGDPSRPMTGPWKQPAEFWSGVNWFNNPRFTDWKVEVFEFSFGDKNDRMLSQAGSTNRNDACGGSANGNRNAVYGRGSMNAPSDYIGCLYCGPEGIKVGDKVRTSVDTLDVIPSRNSINSAQDELNIALDISLCVRRDIPEGSRIVIRLPMDTFEPPTCGREIAISSSDANAPGLDNGKVSTDRLTNYNFYDGVTSDLFTQMTATKEKNDNGAANYGFNRYEPELMSREVTDRDRERYTGDGAYPTNTNGVARDTTPNGDALLRNRRTITITVGAGGIQAPLRPKWYDTSATNTLTSTDEDKFGTRGPTGVRLFTFKLTGFTAPCSVKTYVSALGTYLSPDLPTADLGEYDVRVEFGPKSILDLRNDRVAPCTDRSMDKTFTLQGSSYSTENANDALWTLLRNDEVENLYPFVETLPLAHEQPDILEARDLVPVSRKSNFINSPSNPPSDSVYGITDEFNFNFELKIVSFENDRKSGQSGVNPAGTGPIDVSKYAPKSNNRLQFSFELPSCFVSRESGVRRQSKAATKTNENDGDKLVITFPQNSYTHKCGKVDISNVPKHYEQYYRNMDAALPRSSKLDAWATTGPAAMGDQYVRISDFNNDLDLINAATPMAEILSSEWSAPMNQLSVFGPLADWRISQPKPADKCTSSRRHIVKFEACCFQLPATFQDPGAFKLKYLKLSKRNEDMVELLSQAETNPKYDALPNPASCTSMWGGCGDQQKECVTGVADQARCICIPNHATCCNASHGFNINRDTGMYAGNATLKDDGGVFGYCDKWVSVCERYDNENWGSRCSEKMYMRPRARGLSIAVPCILFFAILVSLIVVIYFVKDQLANIVGPLILGIIICAFSSSCLLCREWYTAFGFACLAIFNIFAAHPPRNSRYMVVCLIVEGLMLLSFFSTGKVLPTRTTQTLIPVYDTTGDGLLPEPACIRYYGFYAIDQALVYNNRDSQLMVGRRLCSRAWIMTLDIFFSFIIAGFVIFWFTNLYFLGRQREAESKERRSHTQAKDTTVRMLVAENNGELLPPVEEVAFPNDAVA